jgi:hypothetical protein
MVKMKISLNDGFELLEFPLCIFHTYHVGWKIKIASLEYSQFRMNCVKILTSQMIEWLNDKMVKCFKF